LGLKLPPERTGECVRPDAKLGKKPWHDATLLLGKRDQQVIDTDFLVLEPFCEGSGGKDRFLSFFRETL